MYKVFIVEDDPMVAMINEKYIARNAKFSVIGKASDGRSALDFLMQNEVDLVILDVYMPHTDGILLLRKMREQRISADVIMVTAANDSSTLKEALHLGVVDYLVKPFSADRLNIALEKYISQVQTLQSADAFDQSKIDRLVESGHKNPPAQLPKGIQEETVKLILDTLCHSGKWLTGEEIAVKISLSSVTVRRYMNYLSETDRVKSKVNYETGGRPCTLYRI